MEAFVSQAKSVDVAVVGAGLAGAAAALGCAQLGLSVALVGPEPELYSSRAQAPFDVRIYALAPGAVTLLERLRVWAALDAARTQRVERMRVFGDDGHELSFDAYGTAVERLATIVEESTLAQALRLGLSFAPNVQRCASALAHVQWGDAQGDAQGDDQAAALTLEDGTQLQARLVLGADGAHSAVRTAAGISARQKPYGQTALVTNFACEQAHQGTAFQWFHTQGVLALLPLPSSGATAHAVSLVWSAPDALAAELTALAPAQLAARVQECIGAPLGELSPLGSCASFPLRQLAVDRLVAPRLALAGDAAHVVHPLAGQGLNLGLQDVAQLLEVLSTREPFRDVGDITLLRRYERARAEAVALMRVTTDGLARLFAANDPLLRWARNAGLGWVNRIAPLKRALIRHALG